jgi:invasion protein IalB
MEETSSMKNASKIALFTVVGALCLSPALAQNAGTPAASAMTKQHSPQSIECSKEADAKGLHGKERKKFRRECKKGKAGMSK